MLKLMIQLTNYREMINNLILLYLSVFVFFQWGQRIALTRIRTEAFLILILLLWTLIKNIA